MFLRATSPLSPTSTLCIPIFCGGRPESDNHFCKAEAFSNESTSQPQGIFESPLDIEVSAVEVEQRIGHLCNVVWAKEGGVLCSGEGVREKLGMRATCKILEASAMVVNGLKALVLKRKPYLLLWAPSLTMVVLTIATWHHDKFVSMKRTVLASSQWNDAVC